MYIAMLPHAEQKQIAQQSRQHPPQVQDRKTGEFYNPKAAFDQLMNTPQVLASLKRLAVR